MNFKTLLRYIIVTIVIGTILFLIINNFVGNEETKGKHVEETISIDYIIYQELRSDTYDNDTFGILIYNSKDEVNNNFKKEVIKSFDGRSSLIYEIDINLLTDAELSGIINDVTTIMEYDKPTLVTPTLLVSKKGSIVIKQEGLIYSDELNKKLDNKNIE